MRHSTSTARPGSQIPFVALPSSLEVDVRSTGTRRTTLAGSTRARNTGTVIYAGVARRVRNRRKSNNVSKQMVKKESERKTAEPIGVADDVAMEAYAESRDNISI
jgi:hypothetical protein